MTFLADSADTAGAYSLMEATLRPGDEPPPHVYTAKHEAYYILDGRLTFRCGTAIDRRRPRALLFLPRGLLHTFTVRARPARVLVLISPGGLDAALRELCGPTPPFEHVLDTFGLDERGPSHPLPPRPARRRTNRREFQLRLIVCRKAWRVRDTAANYGKTNSALDFATRQLACPAATMAFEPARPCTSPSAAARPVSCGSAAHPAGRGAA